MFASALVALSRHGAEFIVVGGLAVAEAGFARVTDDVDVLVEASPENLRRVIAGLSELGEGHAAQLAPEDFPLEEGCVRIAEEFDTDVFTLMSGHTYADLLPLSRERDVQGYRVRFLGAEGLVRLKEASLRPKDQIDAAALRGLYPDL